MSSKNGTTMPVYRLWAFGSNGSGQLGTGHTEDTASPQSCKGNLQLLQSGVLQLAAGGNHTVAIFKNGKIGTAGDNSDGRGISSNVDQTCTEWESQEIPGGVKTDFVRHIGATWNATIAAFESDVLCVAGTGNSGELGLGPDVQKAVSVAHIKDHLREGHTIVKIASCMAHVVVVLSSGKVLGWGKGRKGQLGERAENVWEPRKIEGIPFKVVNAVCGKDFTCFFGSPASGELLVLGSKGNDRFGVKKDAPDSVPGWKQVAASWGSIYVLLESGELLSWGRDDHGQLAPPGLPLLSAIAAGSEHCLGLTKDGKVLAWGWGEHGNCGMHVDDKGDVKGRYNTIAMSQPATAIFAGCATSFIVTSDHFDPSPTETPS